MTRQEHAKTECKRVEETERICAPSSGAGDRGIDGKGPPIDDCGGKKTYIYRYEKRLEDIEGREGAEGWEGKCGGESERMRRARGHG
jgi:hypothetical protein